MFLFVMTQISLILVQVAVFCNRVIVVLVIVVVVVVVVVVVIICRRWLLSFSPFPFQIHVILDWSIETQLPSWNYYGTWAYHSLWHCVYTKIAFFNKLLKNANTLIQRFAKKYKTNFLTFYFLAWLLSNAKSYSQQVCLKKLFPLLSKWCLHFLAILIFT